MVRSSAALAGDLSVIRAMRGGAEHETDGEPEMKEIVAFVASFGIHCAILLVFLAGLLSMNGFRDKRLPLLGIATLIVVAGVAFFKQKAWASRADLPFGLGLIAGAVAVTTLFLGFSYALSHPVGTPPPFLSFLAEELQSTNTGLWVLGPLVLCCVASALGHALGKRSWKRAV
jgi:hypothetical protein